MPSPMLERIVDDLHERHDAWDIDDIHEPPTYKTDKWKGATTMYIGAVSTVTADHVNTATTREPTESHDYTIDGVSASFGILGGLLIAYGINKIQQAVRDYDSTNAIDGF